MYTTVERLRLPPRSIPEETIGDEQLDEVIADACAIIEQHTRQWFEPRQMTLLLDGYNSPVLNLDVPIIELTDVRVRFVEPDDLDQFELLDIDDIAVYNRYLTTGMLSPDDRRAPRLQIEGSVSSETGMPLTKWPRGEQNIELTGTFGFVEPAAGYAQSVAGPFVLADGDTLELRFDGAATTRTFTFAAGEFADIAAATASEVAASMNLQIGALGRCRAVAGQLIVRSALVSLLSRVEVVGGSAAAALQLAEFSFPLGVTPREIVRAAEMLVADMVVEQSGGLLDLEQGSAAQQQRLVRTIRTVDQEVQFESGRSSANAHQVLGRFTGNPRVDAILVRYARRVAVEVV